MRKISLCVLMLLVSFGIAFSETVYAPDPSSVLGARPLGMGGAFVALCDDANATFINPAGLSRLDDWALTSMSTQLLSKVDYMMAAGYMKAGLGTLGVGYVRTSSTAGYVVSDAGELESSSPIEYSSSLLNISYGMKLDKILKTTQDLGSASVGGSLKLISKGMTQIEGAQASGLSMDLGMTMEPRNSQFKFGAVIKNLFGTINWNSGGSESLEQSFGLGASAKLGGKNGLFKEIPGDLNAGIELEIFPAGTTAIRTGAEYRPMDYLALRLGVDSQDVTAITAGVGVLYNGFSFDYAYRMDTAVSELSSHYFSLSFRPELAGSKVENTSVKNEVTQGSENDKEAKKSEKQKESSGDIYELPEEYRNMGLGK